MKNKIQKKDWGGGQTWDGAEEAEDVHKAAIIEGVHRRRRRQRGRRRRLPSLRLLSDLHLH